MKRKMSKKKQWRRRSWLKSRLSSRPFTRRCILKALSCKIRWRSTSSKRLKSVPAEMQDRVSSRTSAQSKKRISLLSSGFLFLSWRFSLSLQFQVGASESMEIITTKIAIAMNTQTLTSTTFRRLLQPRFIWPPIRCLPSSFCCACLSRRGLKAQ